MSVDGAALLSAENGSNGDASKSCPLHGCKRVYTDTESLENHVKDHEIQAESLPGKVMLCSTLGCSGSFPNMQKLMEHMRHHHKPNIFFLCESCRAKLRSFRGLLTHLHTCSKVPRKTKSTEHPPAVTPQSTLPVATERDPPAQQEPAGPEQTSYGGCPVSAAASQQDSALLGQQEASQQVVQDLPRSRTHDGASSQSSSLSLEAQTVPTDPTEGHQTQTTSPERLHPAPGPCSPPGSTAIWRKNQGASGSRRILWEHTKGNYRCVQCGHSATNRREMTQHINSQHNGGKAAEEAASPGGNAQL